MSDVPKKLTFEEWLDDYYPYSERPDDEDNDYYIMSLRRAWFAGQENK